MRDLTGANAARALFVAVIRVYQVIVSPWLGPACRFQPTCSSYAIEAIEAHGVIRGAGLAIRRLTRCHPFGGQGFDPIPEPERILIRSRDGS